MENKYYITSIEEEAVILPSQSEIHEEDFVELSFNLEETKTNGSDNNSN